jgi:hypothetical protein
MGHDRLTVRGDLHVQFERGHPELQRVRERARTAFWPQTQTTSMGLHVQPRP